MNAGGAIVLPWTTLRLVPAHDANEYLHQLGAPMRDGAAPGSPHRQRGPAIKHRLVKAEVMRVADGPNGNAEAWLWLTYDELFA